MHNITILVFGLHHNSGGPAAADVIFVQDEWGLLWVCVGVWLKPPRRPSMRSSNSQIRLFVNQGAEKLFEKDLASRPPLEFWTQVMKSSRNECSLVCRYIGRLPSNASRMVGEWESASPFPRSPEWDLHTYSTQIHDQNLPCWCAALTHTKIISNRVPGVKPPLKSPNPPPVHFL